MITAIILATVFSSAGSDLRDVVPSVSCTAGAGFLVVPAADVLPPGSFVLVAGVGAGAGAGAGGRKLRLGVGALAIGTGLPFDMSTSLSVREGGLVRDRIGEPAALRWSFQSAVWEPAEATTLALEASVDHLIEQPEYGLRVVVSSALTPRLYAGLFVGADLRAPRATRMDASLGAGVGAAFHWAGPWYLIADAQLDGLQSAVQAGMANAGVSYALGPNTLLNVFGQVVGSDTAAARFFVTLNMYSGTTTAPRRRADTLRQRALQPRVRPKFRMRVAPLQVPLDDGYRLLQPELSPPSHRDDLEDLLQQELTGTTNTEDTEDTEDTDRIDADTAGGLS